jgi:hypothetical protein
MGALAFYDRYLSVNPSDAATKAFADRLRGELGGKEAAEKGLEKASSARPSKFNSGVSLGLGGGLVMSDGSDMAKFYPSSSGLNAPGSAIAMGGDLAIDYGGSGGYVIGGQFVVGPDRTHVVENGSGASAVKQSLTASHFGVFLSPGYRLKMGKTWWLEPRLGIGLMSSKFTVKSETAAGLTVIKQYPGVGYGFWPELRLVKCFGKATLFAGLGYFWSSAGPYKDPDALPGSSGTYNLNYLPEGSTTKKDWLMNTSGPSLRLGLAYHFTSPV